MNRRSVLLAALASLAACSADEATVPSADNAIFQQFAGTRLLGVDARRDDPVPALGLTLRYTKVDSSSRRVLVLPVSIRTASQERSLLTASASYDGYSIIDHQLGKNSGGPARLGISAIPSIPPSPTPQIQSLKPGFYFWRNGLER